MNCNTIARELVKAVRRDKAQVLLSRRLGFRGNQLRRWESGDRQIGWDDFTRLCELCDAPLAASLRQVLRIPEAEHDGKSLVARLIGGASQSQISRVTGLSRYTILRWLQGKATPSLEDVLVLIHNCQYMLLELVAFLVDIDQVPTAHAAYELRRERKQVYYRHPIAPAVLCALNLDEYKALPAHVDGYVAEKLRLTPAEEAEVLAALEAVGKIEMKDSRYAVTAEQLELTDSQEIRTWLAFWLDRAATVMREVDNPHPLLNCGFDLYATSRATAAKVKAEYLTYFKNVRALLASDAGPRDTISVFSTLLVDFAAKPAAPCRAPEISPARKRTRRQEDQAGLR